MSSKYKNILTDYKQAFSLFEKKVHNNMLTNHQNTQNAINAMSDYIASNINNSDDKKRSDATIDRLALKAMIDDMNGKILHIFLKDEGLIEFLKNTKVKEFSLIKEYIKENSDSLDERGSLYRLFDDSVHKDDINYLYIALHTENEAYVFYYSYQLDPIKNKEVNAAGVIRNGTGWIFPLEGDYKNAPLSSLAVNLIYYMKAFSEKVFDGVP